MQHTGKYSYDTATAVCVGRRERQEDAIVSDFPDGGPVSFAVLADGMGGHTAGDIASKIVVTEVFSELMLQSGDAEQMERNMSEILRHAAQGANDCVGLYSQDRPEDEVMGATLLAPVLIDDRLFWISIGDSPLLLMRDGVLTRLNEDHALGSQIDYLVQNGLMDRTDAENHPDQDSLTSVLIGDVIPQIDCPTVPFQLREGDIIIAASDGLLSLTEDEITRVLRTVRNAPAQDIGAILMQAIEIADDPYQDNVTFCVIKVMRRRKPGEILAENRGRRKVKLRHNHNGVTIVAKVSNRVRATG